MSATKATARRSSRPARPKRTKGSLLSSNVDHAAQRPSFEPVAYSADGREFKYEATLSADIAVGGWVILETTSGVRYLGQITREDIDVRDGPAEVGAGGSTSEAVRRRIRSTHGTGVLLSRLTGRDLVTPDGTDVFDAATIETADGATVGRYLDGSSGKRSRLAVGSLERSDGAPSAFLRADGFDRHTFLCGQSGSGKTYALGLVLEQLILQTSLRIVIIDPNSDFVKLNRVRKGVSQAAARAYRTKAGELQVLRRASLAKSGSNAMRVWFSDLAEVEQAATLRLDPLADREEYAELSAIAETFGGKRYSLRDVLKRARESNEGAARQLALRIMNLRVTDWAVWAKGSEKSSAEQLRATTRAAVLDIGTLSSQAAKFVVAANVIGNLWRAREQRLPTLIVIDEAHNICPAEPTDALQANATKYCIDIAAEGRKFGLYLLLSTQRPQKLHPNVLSQCDNLMLMRMNSRADLAELSATFSAVPQTLIEESMRFKMGETLLAGKIVPTPLIARVGGRITEEGGADIPASWADGVRGR